MSLLSPRIGRSGEKVKGKEITSVPVACVSVRKKRETSNDNDNNNDDDVCGCSKVEAQVSALSVYPFHAGKLETRLRQHEESE